MKPKPQLIVVILALAFFVGVACWYWLRSANASVESPVPNPSIDAPPPANSNVAARPLSTNAALRRVVLARGPQEEVAGIGAILRTNNAGALMIVGTVSNSPSAAAGLAGNFLVRKIDDVATEGMKLSEGANLIRGSAGSKLRLELFDLDANEARTVELTRQKLQL